MKYRSESIILLACAAIVSACGGPDAGNSAPESGQVAEEGMAEASSDEAPETAAEADAEMDATSHENRDADHDDDHHAHDDDEEGRLGAHEHGHGMLAVTVQGDMLELSFDAPLISVGAPEDPQDAEDQAEIDEVLEAFKDHDAIITLQGEAGCEIASVSTGTHMTGGHGELQVSYSFECETTGALEGVRFDGFEAYPALEHIEAVFVSDTDQSAAELTAASPELEIR